MRKSIKVVFLLQIILPALFLTNGCSVSKTRQQEKQTTKWFEGRKWMNGLQLKPHETIDQQEFKKQYEANRKGWDIAFTYLKSGEFNSLKPGKHLIDGENVYVMVTAGPGKDPDKTPWEAHQKYSDIHYVVSGKEKIGIAPVASATLTIPYDPARDIAFYTAKGTFYEAGTDSFFIIFPYQAHCPGIRVEGYDVGRKIVIKVRNSG